MKQEQLLVPPLTGRKPKPRATGMTMIIDKGLSLNETQSLLELNNDYIDLIKLAFGTMLLYPSPILTAKINLAKQYGIHLYPGGTFGELVHWRQQAATLYPRLRDLGFEWLEISDGTLTISPVEREHRIAQARRAGFQVITEVGKKDTAGQLAPEEIVRQVRTDLDNGATWVIIEGRESGSGVGIFDPKSRIHREMLEFLCQQIPLDQIIWEAPLKHQQAELITLLGVNVNLGNIPPAEALALEALRQGLRSDTWQAVLKKEGYPAG
jgi:phosphosulfolactate synthase